MPVSLTPAEVAAYGLGTVTQLDIDDAAVVIETESGWTVDQHETVRGIPENSIKRAWAVVSAKVRDLTAGYADAGVHSETQGDYSYSSDQQQARSQFLVPNMLAGMPNLLLELPISSTARADHRLPAGQAGYYPPTYDDHGVPFPT